MPLPDVQHYITLSSYSNTYIVAYWINILKKAVIRNRQIFNISSLDNSRIEDYLSYNNKESFKFKGETLKLHIYNDLDSMKDYNTVLLLNEELTVLILMKIITYLNICYGNESTSTETRLTEKYCIL